MPHRLSAVLAAILASALIAACDGDDEAQTVTETETKTVEKDRTVTRTEPPGSGGGGLSEAEAEAAAREAASLNLPPSFGVSPSDWVVSCTPEGGSDEWSCRVRQGPCSGTVRVIPDATIGGGARGDADVGCIAD